MSSPQVNDIRYKYALFSERFPIYMYIKKNIENLYIAIKKIHFHYNL